MNKLDEFCNYDAECKKNFIITVFGVILLVVGIFVLRELISELKTEIAATEKEWEDVRSAINSGYDVCVDGILIDDDKILAEGFTSSTYQILSVDHENQIVSFKTRTGNGTRFLPIIFR